MIKRDIIDLYKKNSAIREISVSQLVEEEDGSRNSGLRIPEDVEKTISFQEERFNLRQEITIYRTLLMEYSIDFDSLVSASPKQAAARRRMIQLAKKLSEDPLPAPIS